MSAPLHRVLFRTLAVALVLGLILLFWVLVRALVGDPLLDWVSIGVSVSLIAATLIVAVISELMSDTVKLRAFWLGCIFVLAMFCSVALASWIQAGAVHLPNASTFVFLVGLVVAAGAASHFCMGRHGNNPPSNTSLERTRDR
jgi:hypothetical protein